MQALVLLLGVFLLGCAQDAAPPDALVLPASPVGKYVIG